MTALRRLWRGEVPLATAFWNWAVVGALLVNFSTTVLFLALLSAGQTWAALVAGYAVSVPYNIVVAVGVWRSAGRYQGPPHWASLARVVTVIAMIVLSLT